VRYLIWNECYVAGGADWSLIDLIAHWPGKDDRFTLFVNRTHEGLPLLREKMPRTVAFREFTTFLERTDAILERHPVLRLPPFRKLLLLWLLARNYWQLRTDLKGLEFDAVLLNNGGYPGALTGYMASHIAHERGIAKQVMIVRNYPPYRYTRSLIMRVVRRVCNRTLDRVVTVSESLRRAMIADSGVDERLLLTIHNGVSVDNKISDGGSDGPSVAFAPGRSVGIVGTLQARKGHRRLFEAWPAVMARFPEVRLYVIGSSKSGDKDGLRRHADALGIAESIVWVEFTRDIGAVYERLDVVVTPSLEYESFGRSVVEAMAFSKPVVATQVGGMPELVDDGVDGYLVAPNDPDALAERISRLLESETTRREMGKAGHAKYRRAFTAEAMVGKYYELFNGVNFV